MQVRDVMTKDVACCTRDTKLPDVARTMVEQDCGAIPVVEDENSKKPVGMITDRDIVTRAVAQGKNPADMTADSCMSDSVVCVSEDASLEDCCKQMEDNQLRRVAVTNDSGACCGIVAQADVARTASEEATGEVVNEVSQPA